jgi:prepilin-type N-terminal cleavage/methylation domain-containing protein
MMMTCRMIGKEKGFTLVEILIVAVMLGLVLGSVYSLYSTNQRSAYIQDEVVDVQQNIRIAMESVTRDIRHAGFLVSRMRQAGFSAKSGIGGIAVGNGNIEQPVNTAADNSGNSGTLPVTADAFPGQPNRVHADILTLNSASPSATFAKIAQKQIGTSSAFDLIVTTPESVDNFNQNEYVRIINPTTHSQATGTVGTVYKITNLDRTVPSIQVEYVDTVPGVSPSGAELKRDFVIAKISTVNTTYPAAITYCLGPANGCAPGVTTCPSQGANDRTMCLISLENGAADVIAARISGLQFTYLLDDGTEVPNTGNGTAYPLVDLGAIRSVRVTITGQTASAAALSGGTLGTGEKSRVMTSVIRLQNRLIQY